MRRLFLLLAAVAAPLAAQQNVRLTLEEAVEKALQQNPDIAAARDAVSEAQGREKQARAAFYPQMHFSGLAKAGLSGSLNGLQPVGIANSPFFDNFATALTFYHPGFDSGRTRHRATVAQFQRTALDAQLEGVGNRIAFQTKQAFYALLRAREIEQAMQQRVASRELNVRRARAFYEGELRSKLELDLARVSLGEAQARRIEARNRVRSATAQLAKAMGASQAAQYELTRPDVTVPQPEPLDELIEQAYENRPELEALRRRVEGASAAVRLAEAHRKPKFSFFGTGGWARITPLIISKLAAVGAGLTFPVLNFGTFEGAVEEAEARLRLLQNRFEELRQQTELETREAYYALENARESIPVRELQLEHAQEAVSLAEARYAEQLGTIVELTEAEAQAADAQAERISTLYAAKTAEARLRLAVGER